MESLLNMEPIINETMHDDLSQDYTKDEMIKAFKQMHPTKALSLDSMPPLFFQRY